MSKKFSIYEKFTKFWLFHGGCFGRACLGGKENNYIFYHKQCNYFTMVLRFVSSSVSVEPLNILLFAEPTKALNSASNPVPVAV